MSAITAKASRKMKKYAVLTREPRCFLGSFDFSWEQRKLGDIGKARSGVGFPDADQGGVTGVPFFKVSDMNLDGNENEMIVANNYVTAEQIADHRWSPITELPAIFFAKVGAAVMLNRKRLCRFPFLLDNNTMAYSLSPTKWDADFAKALFGTVDLTSLVQVGALPSYNAGDVESMGIYLPSLFEQEQIGAFFKLLDNLITLHQRKCANLCSPSQVVFSLLFATSTFSWEQRKFSDITFPAGEKNKDNLPLESYSITNEHGFVPQDEKFENGGTMREADKRMYYIVSPNSFAYNPARINVGSIGYQNIGKNVIVSSLYEVFKTSEDVDDRLLWHWFKSPDFQKLIMQLQEGGVRLYFYYDKLCMGEVSLPLLEEQRKIGKLFDTLDNLITLHQRECISFTGRADRLILTANKKRTTSSWEQRKLGDIADIVGGGTPSTGNQSYWDGDIDWYAPAEIADQIYANSSQKKITGLGYENSSAKMLPPGTVLFTSRAGIGKTAILTRKGCTNQGFQSIVPHRGELDSYFIFSRTGELKRYGELVGAGSTFVEVSGKQMAVMELMMPPTMREQQTIGGFFQQLDHLITLHQRKPFLMKWRTSDANRNQTNRLVL